MRMLLDLSFGSKPGFWLTLFLIAGWLFGEYVVWR